MVFERLCSSFRHNRVCYCIYITRKSLEHQNPNAYPQIRKLEHQRSNTGTLASCSHDNTVKLWDIGYFWDEEEEEEGTEKEQDNKKKRKEESSRINFESNKKRKLPKKFTKKSTKNNDFFDDL